MMETYQKEIKQKLTVVPTEPGCYLMKDRNNQIIYVGKAKKLRNRLSFSKVYQEMYTYTRKFLLQPYIN